MREGEIYIGISLYQADNGLDKIAERNKIDVMKPESRGQRRSVVVRVFLFRTRGYLHISACLNGKHFQKRYAEPDGARLPRRKKRIGKFFDLFAAHSASVVGDGKSQDTVLALIERNTDLRRARADGIHRYIKNVKRKIIHISSLFVNSPISVFRAEPAAETRRRTFRPRAVRED